MNKRWPFGFNFVMYAAFAFAGPYLVLYYQNQEFTGAQIGLLTGITPLITFFGAPFWTGLADSTNRHRSVMAAALVMGGATMIAFPLLSAFWLVLLNISLFNLFFAPVSSLVDSATMHMLGDQKRFYGRVRLGGTLGFGLASILAGSLVERFDLRVAFWGAAALLGISLLFSTRLYYSQSEGQRSMVMKNLGELLRSRHWMLFLVLAFAAGLSLSANSNYFFPYLKEIGMRESRMGLALTLGTLSEIPIFFYSDKILRRFSSQTLLLFGMLSIALRFVFFGLLTIPWMVYLLQIVQGVGFPVFWLAGVAYADENAPTGLKSTAQGLFGAMIFGIGSAAGGLIGGLLLESIGGPGLFLTYGAILLLILAIVYLAGRNRQPVQSPSSL